MSLLIIVIKKGGKMSIYNFVAVNSRLNSLKAHLNQYDNLQDIETLRKALVEIIDLLLQINDFTGDISRQPGPDQ
jgi:hypothetical protein